MCSVPAGPELAAESPLVAIVKEIVCRMIQKYCRLLRVVLRVAIAREGGSITEKWKEQWVKKGDGCKNENRTKGKARGVNWEKAMGGQARNTANLTSDS